MTPQQIALVQETFALVEPGADEVAALFYGRLFEIAPEVRGLFPSDLTDQGRKLMQTLAVAVKALDDPGRIIGALQQLGVRHATRYQVSPEHYAPVGAALLWTLERGLGDRFTPEVETAWTETYGLVSSAMMEAAASSTAAGSA